MLLWEDQKVGPTLKVEPATPPVKAPVRLPATPVVAPLPLDEIDEEMARG